MYLYILFFPLLNVNNRFSFCYFIYKYYTKVKSKNVFFYQQFIFI